MQKWRNWQTRTVQVRVVVIPWGSTPSSARDLNQELGSRFLFSLNDECNLVFSFRHGDWKEE